MGTTLKKLLPLSAPPLAQCMYVCMCVCIHTAGEHSRPHSRPSFLPLCYYTVQRVSRTPPTLSSSPYEAASPPLKKGES